MTARFASVDEWIFDLDNTLYPPSARLFDQIDERMTAFIAEELAVSLAEANRLRGEYWSRYGATLAGLQREHGVEADRFLSAAHDIDLSALKPDARLAAAIDALPGRKIVHTNGPRAYARRVLATLGLSPLFEAVYAIEDTALTPKPARAAFETVAAAAKIAPSRAAMVEDDPRNLAAPAAMGMATLWARPAADAATPEHVDAATSDLADFLERLLRD